MSLIENPKLKIDDIKICDNFHFLVYTTNKLYLYDLRASQICLSDYPLYINFEGITNKDTNLSKISTAVDSSLNDASVLLFKHLYLKANPLLQDFVEVRMLNVDTQASVEDSSAVVNGDDDCLLFYTTSLGELGGTIFNLKNSGINDQNNRESNEGEISSLFEGSYKNNQFKDSVKENKPFIEINNKDLNESSDCSLEEKSESSVDELEFGSAKINEKKVKMFSIESKRKLLESLILSSDKKDLEINMEENSLSDSLKNISLRDDTTEQELEWLYNKFNLNNI